MKNEKGLMNVRDAFKRDEIPSKKELLVYAAVWYIYMNIQGSYRSDHYPEMFDYIDQCFTRKDIENEYDNAITEIAEVEDKYSESIVKARIGQGAYRDALICKHDCKCMICGIGLKDILIASHIKEFSASTKSESIDVSNGLLLCANHDKLFDQHLISFDSNGDIMISKQIDTNDYKGLCISRTVHLDIDPKMELYMQYKETIEIAFYRKGNQLMDNKYYADCLFVEKQFQRRALRKLSVQ